VISALVHDGEVRLSTTLPAGCTAFIDGDWIPDRDGPVPALVMQSSGDLAFSDGAAVGVPRGIAAEHFAASVLVAVSAAAAEWRGSPTGSGLVALEIRRRVQSFRPDTLVETSGRPESIAAAAAALPDLGTLVLAAGTGEIDFDLYPDAHARGLTLVGIGLSHAQGPPPLDEEVTGLYTERLAIVPPDTPLPRDFPWYQLSI
jgi:hypothetical protein